MSWIDAVLRAAGDAEVRVFFGYLVEAGADATKRYKLYLTLDLDDYLEIYPSQVIHIQHLDGSRPLGGAYVWVRRLARLRRVGAKTTEGQADYLRGQITAEHAPRSESTLVAKTRPPTGTGYYCTEASVCDPCASYGLSACRVEGPQVIPLE